MRRLSGVITGLKGKTVICGIGVSDHVLKHWMWIGGLFLYLAIVFLICDPLRGVIYFVVDP